MNSQKALSMFFSLAVAGAFAQAVSAAPPSQYALAFHGGLVNAGCDARLQTADSGQEQSKSMHVNLHLSVALAAHDDACEGHWVPVSAAYMEQASSLTGQRNAVVTLTYH